jgi:hypothetical protein
VGSFGDTTYSGIPGLHNVIKSQLFQDTRKLSL